MIKTAMTKKSTIGKLIICPKYDLLAGVEKAIGRDETDNSILHLQEFLSVIMKHW